MYHINAETEFAIVYNGIFTNLDVAVLENYHVSEAFRLLKKPENNILARFQKDVYRLVRQRVIECILATDMANHSKHLNQMNSRLDILDIKEGKNVEKFLGDNKTKNFEAQQGVLNMIIHTADVSNPGKPYHVYDEWIGLLFQEFFAQGDLEKSNNLPVSLLCDREITNITKAQIGFINYIVKPTFECLLRIVPECKEYMENINSNLKAFESKLAIEQEAEKEKASQK